MKRLIILFITFTNLTATGQVPPAENILFNAFKQGNVNGGGNCASIALIKASIGTFGVGKVFDCSTNLSDSIINVKLRNDSTLTITFKEIQKAIKENGFVEKLHSEDAKEIKKYADTCFAVMVKMNEILRECDSYSESLSALLNGYNTPIVYKLLGVKFKEIPTGSLSESTNVVIYNSYHAVYSSYGYYDETKSTKGYSPNGSFRKNRFGIKCSFYGCKPRRAFLVE